MLREALLAASASTRIRDLITTLPVSRDVVARFVAGETADEALEVIGRLADAGLLATIDYLGEHTTDRDQAAFVADEYIALLGQLGRGGLSAAAEVSVKPTAVGLGLPEHGEKTALENIVRIAVAARNAGTTVTLDMEEHVWVDATLAAGRRAARGLPRPGLRAPVLPAPHGRRLPGADRRGIAGPAVQGRLRGSRRCGPARPS
jgi:proline dehydrogenase